MSEFQVGDRVRALNDWFVDEGSTGVVVPPAARYGSVPVGEFVFINWDGYYGERRRPTLRNFPMRPNEIEKVED